VLLLTHMGNWEEALKIKSTSPSRVSVLSCAQQIEEAEGAVQGTASSRS